MIAQKTLFIIIHEDNVFVSSYIVMCVRMTNKKINGFRVFILIVWNISGF